MPSDIVIKMECPAYLIDFLKSAHCVLEDGSILLPKNHDLIRTLHHLLNRPPKNYQEHNNYASPLMIKLPYFDDKNVLSNFYLSEYSKKLFITRLSRYFKLVFRDDVNQSRLSGFNEKQAINLFIDKYHLNNIYDIYHTLEKDYRRYFNIKYQVKFRKKNHKKSLSVKAPKTAICQNC